MIISLNFMSSEKMHNSAVSQNNIPNMFKPLQTYKCRWSCHTCRLNGKTELTCETILVCVEVEQFDICVFSS